MIDDLYYDDDAKISVMDRADEVANNIPAKYPSFLKHMLPSNVSYSFWLILPGQFCKSYLPKEDAKVILVDECGKEKETKYLVDRHGLSAGWRGFSIDHRLRKGDILVFHLVSPCKLKVNIVRVYGLDVVDAALRLMHFHAFGCRKDSELEDHVVKTSRTHKKAKKCVKALLLDISQHQEPHNNQETPNRKLGLVADGYESRGESAEVPKVVDSGITAHQQPNEPSYCGSYLIQKHFRKGIDCW